MPDKTKYRIVVSGDTFRHVEEAIGLKNALHLARTITRVGLQTAGEPGHYGFFPPHRINMVGVEKVEG